VQGRLSKEQQIACEITNDNIHHAISIKVDKGRS
jgi:hypothetical protein